MSQKIYSDLDIKGTTTVRSIPNATLDTDKFLVSDNGIVKYRTGTEILADLDITVDTASKLRHQVKASVAINKGQAVYAISTQDGTNILVGLASNNSEATSSKTMGLLDATVIVNDFANVVTEGLLEGLDTSTATVGDPVWLGINGNLVYGLVNKPYAPAHLVFIGIVTRVNLNNGEIFVKIQNGFELDEIHDIDLKTTAPMNGHLLGYNGTLWVNKTIAGWLGYTPANDENVVHKTGNETITGQKTFNGTLNSTTAFFNLDAVTNSPTGGVPDAISVSTKGHNGTTNSFVGCLYGTIQNNKNVGVAIENNAADATNSIGFRSVFKNTSTTNKFFVGRRGSTNVFEVNDYGDIYGRKTLLNTTVDNGVDYLQVNGSGYFSNGIKIPDLQSISFGSSGSIYGDSEFNELIVGGTNVSISGSTSCFFKTTDSSAGLFGDNFNMDIYGNFILNATGPSGYNVLTVNTNSNESTFTGDVTVNAIIKSGGLPTEYLMADGSVTTGGGGGGGSTPIKLVSQTLLAGFWTLVGSYYIYSFNNVNIDSTCDISVTPQPDSYLTAYNAQVLPYVGVSAGSATFYSQFPPAADMVVDIVITQTT